jgi:[ribosomal protein S5]-alanine N-acetyltransferase
MNLPHELLTDRLQLRPPTLDDAEEVFARYSHDPAVSKYLCWTPHESVDDTHEYLSRTVEANALGASAGYLIRLRESSELLGSIGGVVQGSRVQFGYCLARDAWGCGYATEAARAFVEAVIAEPSIWRVQAYCDTENQPSARVLEKAGLTLEGTLRRFMVLPNCGDEPRDLLCYAKVRS